MSRHLCHAIHCTRACPAEHLMCVRCWRTVSRETQLAVHRTVKLRGPKVDASWAPWWRAQANAKAEAAIAAGRKLDVDAWLTAQMTFATNLERKAA